MRREAPRLPTRQRRQACWRHLRARAGPTARLARSFEGGDVASRAGWGLARASALSGPRARPQLEPSPPVRPGPPDSSAMADTEFQLGPALQRALQWTGWGSTDSLEHLHERGPLMGVSWRKDLKKDMAQVVGQTHRTRMALAAILGISLTQLATTWILTKDFAEWTERLGAILGLNNRVVHQARSFAIFAVYGEYTTTRRATDFAGPLSTILSNYAHELAHSSTRERSRSPIAPHRGRARVLAPVWSGRDPDADAEAALTWTPPPRTDAPTDARGSSELGPAGNDSPAPDFARAAALSQELRG